ncbi:MAG: proline racemase family protein [Pirellula sp.]|jgi:proline racemase|nr:proline racemase family protein [Pirellula sp.]
MNPKSFRVIDSHTAGEPTRVIVENGPQWKGSTIQDRLNEAKQHHDGYRRALVNEPRGSEVMVGAHLVPPTDADCVAGVIFFNNVGYLGMCGHGMIGVVETLRYLGQLGPGQHKFETVAGIVTTHVLHDGSVEIGNVPSYRSHTRVPLQTENYGIVKADIAYGGNWFCLAKSDLMNVPNPDKAELLKLSHELVSASRAYEPRVDHAELFGAPVRPESHSRNFVLCPGAMYDRSPCGTGTSAKLACLAADGELSEGENWIQEGILGIPFVGRFQWLDRDKGLVSPTIVGRAFVNADTSVILNADDPFQWGIS